MCGSFSAVLPTMFCPLWGSPLVEIQDLAGDGNHYSATVTSFTFSGKSKIEQHKMVYNSLKGKMGNELHALAIKTKETDGSTNQ